MTLVQPILIVLLAMAALLSLWSLRSHLFTRMVALGLIVAGIVFVIHPDLTNRIAHRLGVGRGADLLLYFFLVGAMYGFLVMYVRQRALQEKLTELTRNIAIQRATPPSAAGSPDAVRGKEVQPDGISNYLSTR